MVVINKHRKSPLRTGFLQVMFRSMWVTHCYRCLLDKAVNPGVNMCADACQQGAGMRAWNSGAAFLSWQLSLERDSVIKLITSKSSLGQMKHIYI